MLAPEPHPQCACHQRAVARLRVAISLHLEPELARELHAFVLLLEQSRLFAQLGSDRRLRTLQLLLQSLLFFV